MNHQEKLRHDMVNSVATLKMMAKGVQPIIEHIFNECAARGIKVAPAEHIEIIRQSFPMIEEEAEKMMQMFDAK